MRHRTQYRLPASGTGRGGKILWLIALIALGAGAWVWWCSRPAPRATDPKKPPSVVTPTNVIAPPQPANVARATRQSPQPEGYPRPPRDVLEAQVALAREAISPGSLDGVMGSQTRAALLAFQRKAGLPESLALDAATTVRLSLAAPALITYKVTTEDFARLQPSSQTWLGKSQQTALDYETILELVAEKGRASPNLIRRLNPAMDWTNVTAGAEIQIPDVAYPEPTVKAGFIVISLGEKKLEAYDAGTNLLAHFPCSIAARVEKRPAGELYVTVIAPNPNYTFDPDVFPESAEARELNRKLILPPGPNNPVGTAWISLDKPGYGIHGTPSPEQVGRTESHGCCRLANWNAEHLVKLVWVGMPVYVEP